MSTKSKWKRLNFATGYREASFLRTTLKSNRQLPERPWNIICKYPKIVHEKNRADKAESEGSGTYQLYKHYTLSNPTFSGNRVFEMMVKFSRGLVRYDKKKIA